MKLSPQPVAGTLLLLAMFAGVAPSATLEKLTVEEMSQQATLIVRGRVSACKGEAQGSLIYTRCNLDVAERWKGQAPGSVSFVVPGGRANGLVQTFTGTPNFVPGREHILFLWAGRSGVHQVIGLSQGKFDLEVSAKGDAVARRAASSERMLTRSGDVVRDEGVLVSLEQLRARVSKAVGAVR